MCLLCLHFEVRDSAFKKGSLDSMPFPPGVGGGRGMGDGNGNVQSYDVITADKAIDESNVGNRMLRSMGWQEGSVQSPPFTLLIHSKCRSVG